MAAYKNEFKDASGNKVYPITKADAVYMNDGTTAQAAVKGLQDKVPFKLAMVGGKAGYYNGSTFVPFKNQADLDAAYQSGYNAGRTQGQNDVKGNPNAYGLYSAAQYDVNYSAGYKAGNEVGQKTGYDSGYKVGYAAKRASSVSLHVDKWDGEWHDAGGANVAVGSSWDNGNGFSIHVNGVNY